MPLSLPLLNLQLGAFPFTLLVTCLIKIFLIRKFIYKADQLESKFVEIINPKKINIVIRCIYKHPDMNGCFRNNYLSHILEIVSKEQKQKTGLSSW